MIEKERADVLKECDALQDGGVTWADVVRRTKIADKPSAIVKKDTKLHTSKLFREVVILSKQSNE